MRKLTCPYVTATKDVRPTVADGPENWESKAHTVSSGRHTLIPISNLARWVKGGTLENESGRRTVYARLSSPARSAGLHRWRGVSEFGAATPRVFYRADRWAAHGGPVGPGTESRPRAISRFLKPGHTSAGRPGHVLRRRAGRSVPIIFSSGEPHPRPDGSTAQGAAHPRALAMRSSRHRACTAPQEQAWRPSHRESEKTSPGPRRKRQIAGFRSHLTSRSVLGRVESHGVEPLSHSLLRRSTCDRPRWPIGEAAHSPIRCATKRSGWGHRVPRELVGRARAAAWSNGCAWLRTGVPPIPGI